MTKLDIKLKATELRKRGFSYSFIQKHLGASKGSLSSWLKTIPYAPNIMTKNNIKRSHKIIVDHRKKIKLDSLREASELAIDDIGRFSKRDLLMLGLGIYMGEGSKTICIRIVNSDPTIIKTGIFWLRKIYGLAKRNFSIRIHLYPDCNIDESKRYWSKQTGLPLKQFHPVFVDRRLNKKVRVTKKLPFGTAHVTIRSRGDRKYGVLLMRRILSSIDIVKNEAGLV
ncbi:MAG: hypothetical protein WBL19_02905 [Minisyncoccia bacterium]